MSWVVPLNILPCNLLKYLINKEVSRLFLWQRVLFKKLQNAQKLIRMSPWICSQVLVQNKPNENRNLNFDSVHVHDVYQKLIHYVSMKYCLVIKFRIKPLVPMCTELQCFLTTQAGYPQIRNTRLLERSRTPCIRQSTVVISMHIIGFINIRKSKNRYPWVHVA